jgi:hypothetical protein
MANDRSVSGRRRYPRDTPIEGLPTAEAAQLPLFLVDGDFDRLLPDDLLPHAQHHFTPLGIATRAAELLVHEPGARILDVGAGVGKFCIVGAAHTDGVFVGVEHRRRLTRVASAVASVLELPSATFIHADVVDIDWTPFDGFYFFNPFGEYLPEFRYPLDGAIAADPALYLFYVRLVRDRLAQARVGTRVVTYHGFGAQPPEGYVLATEEARGTDRLQLWIKQTSAQRRGRNRDASVDDHSVE